MRSFELRAGSSGGAGFPEAGRQGGGCGRRGARIGGQRRRWRGSEVLMGDTWGSKAVPSNWSAGKLAAAAK